MTSFPSLAPRNGAFGPLYGNGWDLTVIGGDRIPGRTRASKGGTRLKVDKKDKAGSDGGRPTFQGMEGQEVELEVYIWTDEQLAALVALEAKYGPRPGVAQPVVSLSCPWVANMTAVKVTGVSGLSPAPEYGVSGRKKTFSCLHWLGDRRRDATSTPATQTPSRAVRNVRREDAEKRNPPNPSPASLPGAAGP